MGFFSFCRVSGRFSPFFSLTQKRGGPQAAQTADKLFPGGLEGPQALQSGFVSPGFPRSLNLRGGRWPRPPLVSLPRKYRRSARCRAQPLYLLTPSGRFATFGGNSPQGWRFLSAHLRVALRFAQQPTGLTLPSGAGRAGSLRPWAQTFLKHLAEKAGAAGLFRQAGPAARPGGGALLSFRRLSIDNPRKKWYTLQKAVCVPPGS